MSNRTAEQTVEHLSGLLADTESTLAKVEADDTELTEKLVELKAGNPSFDELEAIEQQQRETKFKMSQARDSLPVLRNRLDSARDEMFLEKGREVERSLVKKAGGRAGQYSRDVKEADDALRRAADALRRIATAPAACSWYATAAETLAAVDGREPPEVTTLDPSASTLEIFKQRLLQMAEIDAVPLSDVRGTTINPEAIAYHAGTKINELADDSSVVELFEATERELPEKLHRVVSKARSETQHRARVEEAKEAVAIILAGGRMFVPTFWETLRQDYQHIARRRDAQHIVSEAIEELGFIKARGTGAQYKNVHYVRDVDAHHDLEAA